MSCACCSIPNEPPQAAPVPQSKTEGERLTNLRKVLPPPFKIYTTTVFNPLTLKFESDITFTVDPALGLITDVEKRKSSEIPHSLNSNDIDLSGKIVLPGFVDAHTHIFLHSYDEKGNAEQKMSESFVERILRASNHCKTALMAGYTTYRDLGSEGMQEADANFRDAVNRGIVIGPRLYVATKVLASVTGIKTHTENTIGGTRCPVTSEECDGEDEIRKAVRRRLGPSSLHFKCYVSSSCS
ncbi:unnamed protein product [Ambrosiozyma monospora]|uniref:Unnamed protein product n=1 Tax=Ambrosiozyma monospora TaxID=43982 RepID=A0ACB5T7K9_AMBMO|nr:unnamed protein product [Ambrosiozyma monospora]